MNFTSLKCIESVNFFTTYRCNSRCVNCFIWKGDDRPDQEPLDDEEILRLLHKDPVLSSCREIGFAGGEPTISPFFWRALKLVPENRHITITTNALSSSKLLSTLNERKDRENFVIQVSIDGIGPVHDGNRGIRGAYDKAVFLLERLRELGVPRLVSFTINPSNFHQLIHVYEIAEALGAKFSARMAYCGGAYNNSSEETRYALTGEQMAFTGEALKRIIDSEMSKKDHYPPKIVFLSKIVDYCEGRQKDIECGAMHTGAVIDLYGEVFPNCPVIMKSLGSLRSASFSEIWHGQKAEAVRRQIEKFACGGCWNDCQLITNIAHDRSFLEKNYTDLKLTPFLEEKRLIESFEMADADSDKYLGTGWYHPEGTDNFIYRWTSSSFSIAVPEGTKSVTFFCMPAPCHDKDSDPAIKARINDIEIAVTPIMNFDWQEITVSFDEPMKKNSACFFDLSYSLSPGSGGGGQDLRDLGLAVKNVRFA